MNVKLLHLYYNLLNLYGDYGNVLILKKHLEDQGFNVTLDKKTVYDEYKLDDYDFVFIGCGTESKLDRALKDLKTKKDELKKYIDGGKVLLATGNSFEMFGNKIDDDEALGIFDFEVKRDKDRTNANVLYSSEYLKEKVVGTVNKATRIYHNMNPFFKVELGCGENENNDYEGVKYKNFYGTHVSGPILARNPELLEKLVVEIGKTKKSNFKLKKVTYANERKGYEIVLELLEKSKAEKENNK